MGATLTRRQWRTWRAKRVGFLDPAGGDLGSVLAAAAANDWERVFLTGPRVGGDSDGFAGWYLGVPWGWEAHPTGHYLENIGQHVLRYRHVESGREVEIHRAWSWFNSESATPTECLEAYRLLEQKIATLFPGGTLLATPATTGRDLFVRTLGDRTYPIASKPAQDLIRHTSGQGRIELFDHAQIPGLAEYDGRLMYGALCWGLGSGVKSWDSGAFPYDPYLRARYKVHFAVPYNWEHVGIFGVKDDDGGWTYPSRPGYRGVTWADGSEVLVAKRFGWPIGLSERIVLHQPGSGAGPLGEWARKLATARGAFLVVGGLHGRLVANGLRAILLHSIGAFHGGPHLVTRTAPIELPGAVPADAVGVRIEGDYLKWGERRPAAWPEMSHPEWSAAIWARCRARLLSGPQGTGALHAPPGTVVAFRTDAVYLTGRQSWPDDGKPGRLRLASWTPGPMAGPRSVAELLRLRDKARG